MVAGRSFLVHFNGLDIEVNYNSDCGLQDLKVQLHHRTGVPPDEQMIMGADDDRTISCDSDLFEISGKLRLVSTSGDEGLLKFDEDFARMLQEREELKGKERALLTPTVMEGNLTPSNRQHSADQYQPFGAIQPLEHKTCRLVNAPSCDGSSNDTKGHGMGVASPSEILHGRDGDVIPRLVNEPSCYDSGNDTNGHGMGVAAPSETLHGHYGDEIPRLVNEPSCYDSGNDTNGHGMGVAAPSETLHGHYGDEIPREITDVLGKVLQVDGSGLKLESELQQFQEQDRRRYIYFLSKILFCVDLENGIREFAGLLLRNELQDADDLVEPWLMDFVKIKSLAIISSPTDSVPRSTCQVISELARIAGWESKQWPELLELIESSLHNEQLLTPAVLETFGCLHLEGWKLGALIRVKILEVLILGMNSKNDDSVRLAATKAMCHTLSMAWVIPSHSIGIILEAIVEAAGSSNLNIKQAAFECLIVQPSRFYDSLALDPTDLMKIMEFTAVAVKERKKDDAFRAIQFWSSLCEVEIGILKKTTYEVGSSCKCYYLIKANSNDLVPLLLSLFDMEEVERDNDFDGALQLCLGYIAQAVGEDYKSFTNPVEPFTKQGTARHKYMAKVINSTMGTVVSDIFGEGEEAGKEGKATNEMERGEGSQKLEKPEKKKELGRWEGILLTRMTNIFEVLLEENCECLHKTMTEIILTYPNQDSISDPTALVKDVSANYFESGAFSDLIETHGENFLRTFCKSWCRHLSMIRLLKLFISDYGCHSKDLETRVLSLVFPKITDAVTEVIDLASNEDKQIDKNLVESVTKILKAHGIGTACAACAESIAMFCENLLKKDVSDEEMKKQLNMVSVVTKFYVVTKWFIQFYIKRVYSRRHDFDLEHESRMLKMVSSILFGGEEKSSLEKSSSSLKNLEHIVNIIVSGRTEDKQKFEEYVVKKSIKDGGMVMSLATSPPHWSSTDASFENIKLPQELVNGVEVVREFIENTPRQGSLRMFVRMIHPLSSCTVLCKFGIERVELDMDTAQATLLMLYNTADKWTFSEILTELGISSKELVSLIHSLSQENNKLLIKVPSTENILPTDCFELNTNFTYTSPIPPPVLEDSRRKRKRKNVREGVNNDMSLTIKCMLKKVMKTRKGFGPMDREKLAGAAIEVCAGLEKCGFEPTRAVVNVSIASMIKDECLLVDENDNNKLWWNEE